MAVSAAAQEAGPSTAFPFLAIDRSAVTSAMGGAQSLSPLYNPAAVPFSGSDVQAGLQLWAPSSSKSPPSPSPPQPPPNQSTHFTPVSFFCMFLEKT